MLPRRIFLSLGLASLVAACVGPDAYFRGADIGATGEGGDVGSGTGGSGTGDTGTGGVVGTGRGGMVGSGNGGMVASGSGGAVGSGSGGMGGRGGSTATTGNGGATGGAGAGGGGGTSPSGTLLMSATFEPGTSDGVHTWVSPDTYGAWATFLDGSNTVWREATVVSSETKSISGEAKWTDQAIEVKTRVTGGTLSSVRVMVYGRYQDDKNFFFLELSQSQIKVRKKVAGSSSDVGKYKLPAMLALNTWYTIKLVISGSTVANTTATGYFNGTPTTPVADVAGTAAIPMGGIGVGVNDGSADFDDVKVTTP
jgi:hypothetical protein